MRTTNMGNRTVETTKSYDLVIAAILGIVACLTVLGMCIAADNGATTDVAATMAVGSGRPGSFDHG